MNERSGVRRPWAMALLGLLACTGCTGGAVAAQGQGVLVPAAGYDVTYLTSDCKSFSVTTASNGQFLLYGLTSAGLINPATFVPAGAVCVTVRQPLTNAKFTYQFDHQFDLSCTGPNGAIPCSKDLFITGSSYDPHSSNAPTSDVHVRVAEPTDVCRTRTVICNLKP